MGAKIKIDLNLEKKIKKIQKDFARSAPGILENEIINTITRGGNPVNKGPRRNPEYSLSYQNSIRRGEYAQYGKAVRPVNLKLSGDMLRSLKVRAISNGKAIRAEFEHYLADIHNRLGAGKSRTVRRVLPRQDVSGEEFSRNIMRKITDLVEELVRKALR